MYKHLQPRQEKSSSERSSPAVTSRVEATALIEHIQNDASLLIPWKILNSEGLVHPTTSCQAVKMGDRNFVRRLQTVRCHTYSRGYGYAEPDLFDLHRQGSKKREEDRTHGLVTVRPQHLNLPYLVFCLPFIRQYSMHIRGKV
jgi:hypothetical protein